MTNPSAETAATEASASAEPAVPEHRDGVGPLIERWSAPAVAVAAVVVGLGYAVAGNGYVLDDWFVLRDVHFSGAWAAGDNWRTVRPGGALVYSVVYGVGRHPLYVIGLLTAINVAGALLLLRLLRRFVAPSWAAAVALLWVLLPTRTSVEVWAAAANIALAVAIGLGALVLLTDPDSRPWRLGLGGLGCVASGLTYEAAAPALLVAAATLPFAARVLRPRPAALTGVVASGSALLWTMLHPDPVKTRVLRLGDADGLLETLGGSAMVPDGPASAILRMAFLLVLIAVAARRLVGDLRRHTGTADRLVLAGLAVAVGGVAPFLLYGYVPLGFGDRANSIASIGTALLWAGALGLLWSWRRPLAVSAFVAIAAGALFARVERASTWATAGGDAARVVEDLPKAFPTTPEVVVFGPKPIIRDNVAAFLDASNVQAALQLAFDRPDLRGRIAFSPETYETAPETVRYDLRTQSHLQPNMELLPPDPNADLSDP